jgi:EAL domain-containing protein (putative c-di-GMP-specific phosphodiesterase class I)
MSGTLASRLKIPLRTAIFAVVMTALLFAGMFTLRQMLITTYNRNAMNELANSVKDRAEIAIDYAVIKLGELHEAGATGCDAASLIEMKRTVFTSGSIKDIVVRDGAETCSVSDGSVSELSGDFLTGAVQARNEAITIKAIKTRDVPAAALNWKFSSNTSATAIVNTEALVFDILPGEMRDAGSISICLPDGKKIALYSGSEAEPGGSSIRFEATSTRYPFIARISIPTHALKNVNTEMDASILIAALLVCSMLGYLVARGLMPPPTPGDRVRNALLRGEIIPHFQPSYDLLSREITGFEVLARWPQKDGGMVPPASFIPVIEAGKLSDILLDSLIRSTATQMRDVIDLSPATTFAFNIAPIQIVDRDFPSKLEKSIEAAGLAPGNVIIEMTERQPIEDEAAAVANIAALAKIGIRTAIDDAGTGHNGLASIQRLGASVLKIDKMFVDTVDHDPRSVTIVQMLVGIASDYGMRTIAEGVESAAQLSALGKLGVDEAQGYYLCMPADATTAIAEFSRHRALLLRDRTRSRPRAFDVREQLSRLKVV